MPERPRLTPPMADTRRAVREAIAAAGIASGDLVLVACSGGADSLALAAATAFEGPRAGIRVGALIVEHGLQEVTKQVAARTDALLRDLGLDPVRVLPVTVGTDGGTEAAARTARYAALESAARELGAKAVLLGHTLSDQAETVLLGLARGSGLKSIAGMAVVTAAGQPGLLWLRPLLEITRAQTEAFCVDSGLEFWLDPQNSDSAYSRVRVRTEVLPVLESQIGPGVAEALARTAALVQDDLHYLEAQAETEYRALAKVSATGITISAAALGGLPAAISGRVVHRCLGVFGDTPSKTHVDQVLELVRNWHGQKELTLPGVRVVRHSDDLTFKSSKTLRPGAC
jgi:tRNA(Ile)-lysidine synthase